MNIGFVGVGDKGQGAESRFSQLIQEFAAGAGFADEAIGQSDGIEFESEGFTARLTAHPTSPALMVIEVDVAQANPGDPHQAKNAWLLHQINHAARFEHGWLAHIDESNILMMSSVQEVDGLNAAVIEQLLADAIDRAEALANLWLAHAQADEVSAQAHSSSHLIRG